MKNIKLSIFVVSLIASSAAFGANTVTTYRKVGVEKNCAVWDTTGKVLRKNGVSVTLGKTTKVCYRDNLKIYRYSTVKSTFHSKDKHLELIVAFATALKGQKCENNISQYNYSRDFEILEGDTFEYDIDALGSGATYDEVNTDSLCAELFTNKPNE